MANFAGLDVGPDNNTEFTQRLGIHQVYGFAPAYSLLEGACAAAAAETEPDEAAPLRVLVAGPSDGRHVLATLARRRRLPAHVRARPVEMHVWDKPLEALARTLLMLEMVHDFELPVRQRACVVLEVFGNAHLTERTARYVARLGENLVGLVTDGRGALADMVDLSALKFRARDDLVTIFRSWETHVPFDVAKMRDDRLRVMYGARYDAKKALGDWDYQQRVNPTCSVVHSRQYRQWRDDGLAYEFGDATYTAPNRTLASYAEGIMNKGTSKGMKREVRGFFLDLANSPYAAFGIAPLGGHGALGADDEHEAGLYEIQNKGTGTEQHRHNTTEVAMYNMISMLSEIETGEAYAMSKPHDLFSGLGGDATDVVQAAAGKGAGTAATKDAKKLRRHAAQRAKTIVETLTDFKLVLHSGDLPAYLAKPRHRATFHRGHISSKSVGLCEDAAAMGCFKPGAPVSVETAKTLFVLDDKLVKAYEDSVCGKAKDRGWVRGPGDEYRWDFTLPAAPAEPPVAVADEPVVLD